MLRMLAFWWILTAVASAETVTLEAGWTPVAFPGSRLLSLTTTGPVVALAWYDGRAFHVTSPTLARVNELGTRRAFYFFAQGTGTLTYDQTDDGGGVALAEGWNLVSLPRRPGRELSGRENLLPQVYPADGRPPLDLESTTFEAGRAYWVYSRAAVTLQFGSQGSLGLPLTLEDSASLAYTVVPFGCHLGDHGVDGHPGWDFEYRPGAPVRCAGEGTVQIVTGDSHTTGRFVVQVLHGSQLRTVYTNVVNPVVSAGQRVVLGQPLGEAGSQTLTIGQQRVTFQMCHFQVDDFTRNEGLTNPNAVNPEGYLSAAAQALFAQLWARAAYGPELVEPFPGNPRDASFPLTRTWVSEAGSLRFTRASGSANEYTYALGPETGRVTRLQGEEIELTPDGGGPVRRGRFTIVSGTLRLDLGAGAVTYTT